MSDHDALPRRPVRRGPVPRGLLTGIALVALGLGVGAGWMLFGSSATSANDDLAAMCAVLAIPGTTDGGEIESTGDAVDPVVYRASAVSSLALSAVRQDPDVDPIVAETGAAMREHLGTRDYDLLAEDLATLAETC